MDKRTETIYLRLPYILKRLVKKHAISNGRSVNSTIIYLVSRGIHADEFNVRKYVTEQYDEDENGKS